MADAFDNLPDAFDALPDASRGNVPVNAAIRGPRYPATPQVTQFLNRMLPAAYSSGLGLVGLMYGGGPGGGLGTLAGQKIGQFMQGGQMPPPSPSDALMFGVGAAGPMAEGGAQAAAPSLMQHALRPTAGELSRFPGMVNAALARGERVGAPGAAMRAQTAEAAAAPEIKTAQASLMGSVGQKAGLEREAAANVSKQLITTAGNKYPIADLAQRWIATSKKLAGPAWNQKKELQAIAEVRGAVRELLGGHRMPTVLDDETLDLVRQQAREQVAALKTAQQGGKFSSAPNLINDIETQARSMLHNTVGGLRASRTIEAQKRAVIEASSKGNQKALARLAARGDQTAAQGLVPVQAGPLEQNSMLASRLLAAAQNRLPWYENYGAPIAAGGGAFAAGHNPLMAALAAAATRAAVSPRVQSQAALTLANPMVQQLLRYGPLTGNLIGRGAFNYFTPPDTTK